MNTTIGSGSDRQMIEFWLELVTLLINIIEHYNERLHDGKSDSDVFVSGNCTSQLWRKFQGKNNCKYLSSVILQHAYLYNPNAIHMKTKMDPKFFLSGAVILCKTFFHSQLKVQFLLDS